MSIQFISSFGHIGHKREQNSTHLFKEIHHTKPGSCSKYNFTHHLNFIPIQICNVTKNVLNLSTSWFLAWLFCTINGRRYRWVLYGKWKNRRTVLFHAVHINSKLELDVSTWNLYQTFRLKINELDLDKGVGYACIICNLLFSLEDINITWITNEAPDIHGSHKVHMNETTDPS